MLRCLLHPHTRVARQRSHTLHNIQQLRKFYPDIKRPDPNQPLPWKHFKVPQNSGMQRLYKDQRQSPIHVALYNPKGKAVRPPEPVIMIHGLTSNHAIFDTMTREMNYPYGMISMDLVGRGRSQAPKDGKVGGLKRHVLDFIRVLDFFGYMRTFVVGQDIGGIIGYMACKMFPDRISGIVMIDSGFSKLQVPNVANILSTEIEQISLSDWNTKLRLDETKYKDNVNLKQFIRESENAQQDKLRAVALEDLQSLKNDWTLEFDELIKIRHPIAFVRPEKSALIDEKTQKEIETNMNVKKSTVIKGSDSRHQMMFDPNAAKQIAGIVDYLLSEYDEHRKVQIYFEKIKNSFDEREENRREF
jgi:pimeloyl-ACP methyl ester carboxylesterase